jgi:cytochrome c-type biogenesis protein CcmH
LKSVIQPRAQFATQFPLPQKPAAIIRAHLLSSATALSMLRAFVFLLVFLSAASSRAAIDTFEFSSDENRQRYSILVDELRCPKCKNNNLSGSNSMIATDLKREIHTMVEEGKTNQQIAEFMVDRYGDFVLYRPRMTAQTALLWGAPVALFLLALVVVVTLVRGRAKALKTDANAALSADEQAQLMRLTSVEAAGHSTSTPSKKG